MFLLMLIVTRPIQLILCLQIIILITINKHCMYVVYIVIYCIDTYSI